MARYEDGTIGLIREDGTRELMRDVPICDFCLGDPQVFPIKWSYPTGPMRLPEHPLISHTDDPWGACDECHALIEADDFKGLAERILLVQVARFGGEFPAGTADKLNRNRSFRKEMLRRVATHLLEWKANRLGPAIPEGEFDPRTGMPTSRNVRDE